MDVLYLFGRSVEVGVDVVYLRIVCRSWGGCCISWDSVQRLGWMLYILG